jgi:hypothetical protein
MPCPEADGQREHCWNRTTLKVSRDLPILGYEPLPNSRLIVTRPEQWEWSTCAQPGLVFDPDWDSDSDLDLDLDLDLD